MNAKVLSARLGVPVVPTAAIMGHGIAELFRAAVHAVRAVVDGLIGLIGIVVPYMIPLVLLLVALFSVSLSVAVGCS